MNSFDLVSLIIIVIALLFGFFQGAVRMIIVAMMSYIGLIISGLYFQTLGDRLHLATNIGLLESYCLAYITVFVLCMLTLSSMGVYTFRFFRGNTQSVLNRIIGLLFSVVTATFLIGAFAHLMVILPTDVTISGELRSFIGAPLLHTIATARFATLLSPVVAPLMLRILDPFVFSDINLLFPPTTP